MHEPEVRTWIVGYLADFLSLPPEDIGSDVEFTALGLDSVDAVVIGGALEERFDVEIDAAMLLRCSTIDELIADLAKAGLIAG